MGMGVEFELDHPHPWEDVVGVPNSLLYCWFLITYVGVWDYFE